MLINGILYQLSGLFATTPYLYIMLYLISCKIPHHASQSKAFARFFYTARYFVKLKNPLENLFAQSFKAVKCGFMFETKRF